MRDIDEYDSVDEMEDRLIDILRGQGDPEGETDDGTREVQELAQSILVIKLVHRGIDVDTAIHLIDRDGANLRCSVDSAGTLDITMTNPSGDMTIDIEEGGAA